MNVLPYSVWYRIVIFIKVQVAPTFNQGHYFSVLILFDWVLVSNTITTITKTFSHGLRIQFQCKDNHLKGGDFNYGQFSNLNHIKPKLYQLRRSQILEHPNFRKIVYIVHKVTRSSTISLIRELENLISSRNPH